MSLPADLAGLEEYRHGAPTVRAWAGVVRALARRIPKRYGAPGGEAATAYPHPFQVTVARWEDEAAAGYGIPAERLWQANIRPGLCNDLPARLLYLQAGDLRGWAPPEGYMARQTAANRTPTSVRRSLLEPDEPPFLVLQAPDAAGTSIHFQPVADAARPEIFRTAEMWERSLFRGYLYLTVGSTPTPVISVPDILAVQAVNTLLGGALDPALAQIGASHIPRVQLALGPYQLGVSGREPHYLSAEQGGSCTLAELWLARDPTGDPALDELFPQQQVFRDMGAAAFRPAAAALEESALAGSTGLAGALTENSVEQLSADSSYIRFWSR